MHKYSKYVYNYLFVACLAITLSACCFRHIQNDFNNGKFTKVNNELTQEYISEEKEKRRPNAYYMKAYSQLEIAKTNEDYVKAIKSAEKGLKELVLLDHSRDKIFLMMIPALAIDKEIEQKWKANNEISSYEDYYNEVDGYERHFITIFEEFKKPVNEIRDPTPLDVVGRLHYEEWRAIQNWRTVINSIDAGDEQQDNAARMKAHTRAKSFFEGNKLSEAANAERDAISEEDVGGFRERIIKEGG